MKPEGRYSLQRIVSPFVAVKLLEDSMRQRTRTFGINTKLHIVFFY